MRGDDRRTSHLFSYVSPEPRVPADQPLRAVRMMTDAALATVARFLDTLYATTGRPSISPEQRWPAPSGLTTSRSDFDSPQAFGFRLL